MTSISDEELNCRRFLAAWNRFRGNENLDINNDILTQYEHLALHFQHLIEINTDLKPLKAELSSVLATVALLKTENGPVKPGRILRPSEIAEKQAERAKSYINCKAFRKNQEEVSRRSSTDKKPMVAVSPGIGVEMSSDDFKAMLEVAAPQEEKLSTKTIRKRLGLLDRSGAQPSASETVVREEQESIKSEMMSLAKQLKQKTQTINQSLTEDVKILDAVGQSAESNSALLDRENAKLKQQLASSIGLWTSLWLVAMLVVVFIATYFYLKLFSRRW